MRDKFNFCTIFSILHKATRCCMLADGDCSTCPFHDDSLRKSLSLFFGYTHMSCEFLRHFCIDFLFDQVFPDGVDSLEYSCDGGLAIVPIKNRDYYYTDLILPF